MVKLSFKHYKCLTSCLTSFLIKPSRFSLSGSYLSLFFSPSLSDDNMSFDKLLPATKVYKVDTEHGLLLMEQFEPGSGFEMVNILISFLISHCFLIITVSIFVQANIKVNEYSRKIADDLTVDTNLRFLRLCQLCMISLSNIFSLVGKHLKRICELSLKG